MSLEKNKAIILKMAEAFNKRDLDLLDDLIAPDFADLDTPIRSLESYKQYEKNIYNAFPDINRTIEDIVAEGDKVWIRIKGTATHKGEYLGLAPTGKKFTLKGVMIWRIVDGKVVEKTGVYDFMDLYKQIGVIEYTEKGKKLFPQE